jgi:O-antigen/teichoic acid export membrane protein
VRLRLIVLAFNLGIFLAIVVGVETPSGRHFYPFPHFDQLLIVTMLALPMVSDLAVLGAVYKAREDLHSYAFMTLYLQPVVRVVLVAAAIVYTPDVFAIVCIGTLQAAVCWAAVFTHDLRVRSRQKTSVSTDARPPEWAAVKAVLHDSIWMAMNQCVYSAMRFVDVLMLSSFAPAKLVGEYGALSTFAQLVQLYPLAASQALGPTVSRHFHEGNLAGLRTALNSYIHFASVTGSFVFAGIAVFGDRLDLLFGPSFQFHPQVCFLLPLGYLLSAALAPVGYALSMTGRHKSELLILAAGAVILVVLCLLLVPPFQQVGAASAVVAAFFLINAARFAYVSRVLGFTPGRMADLLPPIVAIALAVAARRVFDLAGERSLLVTSLACVTYTALYATYVLIMRYNRCKRACS